MNESEQLEQAIAALEDQRAGLGDAVVDAAQAPLREKLAALMEGESPARGRRAVDVERIGRAPDRDRALL